MACASRSVPSASCMLAGKNAGESSTARASACSGVIEYVPLAGSYLTYPPAAWFASHGRT